MLDIKFIRENPELIKEGCRKKQIKIDIDQLLEIDKKRKELMLALEDARAQKNKANEEINKFVSGEIKQLHEKGKKEVIILKMRELDKNNDRIEAEFKELDGEFQGLMGLIPNPPAPDVEEGKDDTENKVIKKWGKLPEFDFEPKSHFELGESLDIIDTKRAGKVSGSRFGYLKNGMAKLELAMINFAVDFLSEQGFIPVIPPVMISLDSMKGMGYLEHGGEENMYILDKDNLVLVGTSEQSIGPMHKDETFEEKDLPKRYIGISTCFRREAGSYGKDTKGILRVHQFNKVEMFSFTKPEDSDKEHEYLLSLEEKLMQALELPYQVVKMCSGDLGMPAARKYDIEVWLPSENRYRETHSTSTCTDFQARRLNIRFKRKDGKSEFVHMLNGTAFSERPILAILENYQQKDGSVLIPKVLQKYTGFEKIEK
ncbi:serine--tRNA ligase [Patescibacteria group bacterium]|nr:serine--tRNA ligase [Patescibacteria group bacterium]